MIGGVQGVLRAAIPSEVDRISAFLKADASGFLRRRPESELLSSAEQNLAFIIEERDTEQLIAVACAFDLDLPNCSAYQLGAARVLPAYQGLGLQSLLLSIRVISVFINNYHCPDLLLHTFVRSGNPKSFKNVEKAGFTSANPIPSCIEQYLNKAAPSPEARADLLIYILDKEGYGIHAAKLLKYQSDSYKAQRSDQLSIQVEIDLDFLRDDDGVQLLREIAGPLWNS